MTGRGNDCLISVDGANNRVPNQGPDCASHKHKKRSALRCEIALCVLTGDIVWINGPHQAGLCPDIETFRDELMMELLPNESQWPRLMIGALASIQPMSSVLQDLLTRKRC